MTTGPGAAFLLVAAVTPGPTHVMLTATGAPVGVLRGLPCLLGVSTSMGLMLAVWASCSSSCPRGLGSLVLDRPLALRALHWGGAAAASLGTLFVVAALPSGLSWLALGAAMQRPLHSPRRTRVFAVTMGALLARFLVIILR